MTMSDRIAVIDDGDLQQFAPPLECYHQPANLFVAGFIGSPAMNLIDGTLTADGFVSDAGYIDVDFAPDTIDRAVGQEVVLGVRPEHVLPTDTAVGDVTGAIDTYIDVTEPMGKEIFVYLVTDQDTTVDMETPGASGQLLMSVGPAADVGDGEPLSVVFDKSNLHLFDADSEAALAHGLSEPTAIGRNEDTPASADD